MRRLLLAALTVVAASSVAFAQARPWPSEGHPPPLAAHAVTFPPYEVRTLENGLQVVAVLHHEQPVVSIRMIVRAGAALDPPGKAGLADLTASLLDQGTTTHSANEMNDRIDFIGGAMGAGAGADLTFINVVVMKDSFETGLGLISDMARHPAFAPEEIERTRTQALSTLQVTFQDPDFVADAVFDRLVYGFHPYGLPQSGTPQTLRSITRPDILAFHQRNFVPNNAILAIVGDVTAEQAFDGAGKVFGDWERRDVQRMETTPPPEPSPRVIVINKPDAVQTEVRVGHLGIRRNAADYMALNVALRILGGEGANRLHQVLRSERALTYSAKADLNTLLETGDIKASTNTRSPATGEVLQLIVDEFLRLRRERIGERELSGAKAYMTGSFPLTIETPDAIALQVLNVLFYGLPVDELQSFRERVNAVRADDIARVANTYLHPDVLSVVLVGNASAFVSQLRGAGFDKYELIDMADLDLLAVNFKRGGAVGVPDVPAAPGGGGGPRGRLFESPAYQSVSAQAVGDERLKADGDARSILARMIDAKGGLDRLRAVKSIRVTTHAVAQRADPAVGNVETVTYLQYPNRVRVESTNQGTKIVQGFDGTQAWLQIGGGTGDVPDGSVRNIEAFMRRDSLALLESAWDGRTHVRRLLDSRDASGARELVLEFSAADLDPTILYVRPETAIVTRQTYFIGAGSQRQMIDERYSDYRAVDGVQVAFDTSVRVRGEIALNRRVTQFTVNPTLSPTLFARPDP